MIETDRTKNDRWATVIQPQLERCFITRRGKKVFDAVLKDAALSCAFLNDYGDHCEELNVPISKDVEQVWDRSAQKIIRNIIRHDDPYYDPVMELFTT
jgi:hypothetical protein